MTRTCSECAQSSFIEKTLTHYCRKKEKIIVGPRETAKKCDAYGDKKGNYPSELFDYQRFLGLESW